MKKVKMNWVQTPYLRNGSIGINAKVAFDCFVDSDLFELAKNNFDGYISKNGKKTALYSVHVISNLMKNGIRIQLDGVDIQKSEYYGCDSLIEQSENCTNKRVVELAKLYKQVKEQKSFINVFNQKLNELFDNKPHIETKKTEPADIKWEKLTVGNIELFFDLNYGVEKTIRWEERSHEDFTGVPVYRSINLEKIEQLKKLVEDTKNRKPLVYDENYQWQPGFDESTYEQGRKTRYSFR
jgi:hypothetical protein